MKRIEEVKKRPGAANSYGTEYEFLLAGLINARARQEGLEFDIVSNVEGAGAFDDVIVRIYWEEEGVKRCITYFIQLKHAENDKEKVHVDALTAPSGKYSLRKYFEDFKKLKGVSIDKGTKVKELTFSQYLYDEFRFVFYTNREMPHELPTEVLSTSDNAHSQFPKSEEKRPAPAPSAIPAHLPHHHPAHRFSELFTSEEDSVFTFTSNDTAVWNLLDSDETASEEDKRMYREEFLPRLLIFSCQKNVYGLKLLIQEEINNYFGLDSKQNDDILFNTYVAQLKRWHEKKDSTKIRETTRQLENSMREKLDQVFNEQLNQSVDDSLHKRLRFAPEKWTDVLTVIKENKYIIFETSGLKTHERCLKFLQIFKDSQDYDTLFLSEKSLQKYNMALTKLAKSLLFNGVVFVAIDSPFAALEVLNNLRSDCECKFVFACSRQKDELRSEDKEVIEIQGDSISHFVDEWCLDQLTQDCQEDILNCKVSFQGRKMQLKDLESAWPSLREDVDAKMLLALLVGNATLGGSLPQLEDTNYGKDDCYIPRSLDHRPVLRKEVLYADTKSDHFVLSMFPKEIIDEVKMERAKRRRSIKPEDKKQNDTLHILPREEKRHLEKEKLKFEKLCAKFPNNNIHLLVYDKKSIIWTATRGESLNIKSYLSCSGLDCRPTPLCSHTDLSECQAQMLLLSGEPGIGKSTFVFHLAREDKVQKKWIVPLPLLSHTKLLYIMPAPQNMHGEHLVNLLAEAVQVEMSSSPRAAILFLKKCLMETGHLSVYMDGVDEVCPAHKEKAMRILKLLQESRASKVWVTSRMHLDDDFKEIFRLEPFRLRSFTQAEQLEYICRVVETGNGEHLRETVKEKVSHILEQINLSIGRTGRGICDLPLHANILAELLNENMELESKGVFSILKLYQEFVSKKYRIYSKKNEIEISSPKEPSFKNKFLKIHSDCAMVTVAEVEGIVKKRDLDYIIRNYQIELEEESTGILNFENELPRFIHYTFAEYFVASWLSEHYRKVKKIESVWKKMSPTLKYFLNAMLAEGYPANEAAIIGDPLLLRKQISLHGDGASLMKDKGGRTPLHLAAIFGHTEACRLMLAFGGSDIKDNLLGWTPLRYADHSKYFSTIDVILENSIVLDDDLENSLVENAKTGEILLTAASEGHNSLATALMVRGADVNRANEVGFSPLYLAAFYGQEGIVKLLIENGANLNTQDINGFTPLHAASQEGYCLIVELLLSHNVEINAANARGSTALHLAAENGQLAVTQVLLINGADIEAANVNDETPLKRAAFHGHDEVTQLLAKNGANVNTQDKDGFTPLQNACQEGYFTIVVLLLSHNAEINGVNTKGTTALHLAAGNGRLAVTEMLLSNGADIEAANVNGETPLYRAAIHGHADVTQLLVKNGANVNAKDINGFTPLQKSSQEGYLTIVELLLSHGAEINAANAKGTTALHLAAGNGRLAVTEMLLSNGANMEAADVGGRTPLLTAALLGHEEVIQMLVKGGANVNTQDNNANTPLQAASQEGYLTIVKLLLSHSAEVNSACARGTTALSQAANNGRLAVTQLLLSEGADIAAANANGETPLHRAAFHGHDEVTQLLLRNGANVNTQDRNGFSPLQIASQKGHLTIVELLLSHNADINGVNTKGTTALHLAANDGRLAVTELLLSKGADIEAENVYGDTPLLGAAIHGQEDVIQLLVKNKANVNAKDINGFTPLQKSSQEGYLTIVELLLSHGAEINAANAKGITALHLAAIKGRLAVTELLLSKGANVQALDEYGKMAIHYATLFGHGDVMSLLL